MKKLIFSLFVVLLVGCQQATEPKDEPTVIVIETPAEPVPVEPVIEPIVEPIAVIPEVPVVEEPVIVEPVVEPVVEAPVIPDPKPNVRVYNSAWEIVQEGYVSARAVNTIQSYSDYVKEYNEKTKDDQFFLVEGEKEIPIEEAPAANAYIVDPVTHDIIKEYKDWPRADIKDRREVWRQQAYADAGVLYVDRVPPPPIVIIDERPAFEKYALYLIYTADNSIKNEEHLETEAEYLERKKTYELQAYADGGLTYVVSGKLYP